jgi:hypothetical protein
MYWYLEYSWYDIMMHILTGAGIALSAYWFIETVKKDKAQNNLWLIILITFVAGVIWEVLEAKYGIAGFHFGTTKYWIDTVKDMADDMLGSLAVYIIFRKYF